MTPQQWAETIGGSMVAFIGVLLLVLAAWRKLAVEIAEFRRALAVIRQQSTKAATSSEQAATSAARVDDSLHNNNGGAHIKDFTDELRESVPRLIHTVQELRDDVAGLVKDQRGIRRDVGRLADVDREDRERAQREHAEIRADVAEVAGALKDHVAEVPAVVDAAKRQAIAELGLDRNP